MSLFQDHQVKMMTIKVTAIGHRNFYGGVTVIIPNFWSNHDYDRSKNLIFFFCNRFKY
jgi:hypothetical protein